jgi:hypothetical protein
MSHQGSCHCGRVRFRVAGEIAEVTDCNCSICRRKAMLMWFVPREALVLDTPEGDIATYTFNAHVIRHRFCPTCGIHVFGEVTGPDGIARAAVNARCLDDVDLAALTVNQYNGRELR